MPCNCGNVFCRKNDDCFVALSVDSPSDCLVSKRAMSESIVPGCPKGLAFSKEDFLDPQFSIEGFLGKCTATTSLERIRDDLGIYLKVLRYDVIYCAGFMLYQYFIHRTSMIELINQDYADFVNLSTNLVGLDQSISTELKEPLASYQLQIQKTATAYQTVLQNLDDKVKLKSQLHQKRIILQNLEHISVTLNKIEKLLGSCDDISGEVVERVAVDIHHLNYCMTKCPKDSAFYKATTPRLDSVCDRLHASMESQLMLAIKSKDSAKLRRCLRIYSTVDRTKDAEILVKDKIVSPFLEDILTEKSLTADPQGLKGVYQRVLKIIPTHLNPLLELTQGSKDGHHVLRDFNFLVRSLFPDIVEKFEDNLALCFSAGNPEKFHTNYSHSMDFLNEFEDHLGYVEALDLFRSSDCYQNFVGRWNLAVYFQIRFQEIALPVEVAMEDVLEVSKNGSYKLDSTEVAANALKKCMDPSVCLPILAPKFIKLSFQILSRYSNGISKCLDNLRSQEDQVGLKSSVSSAVLAPPHPDLKRGHARSASADQPIQSVLEAAVEKENEKREKLLMLHLDITSFSTHVATTFLSDLLVYDTVGFEQELKQAINESCNQLSFSLEKLDKVIIDEVTRRCCPFLKQVSDIPRLYRRTNREIPSKPLPYVTSVLEPIQEFYDETKEQCSSSSQWCSEVVSVVAEKYLENVREVLEAVQKMEESLKRLKRARDAKNPSASASENKDKTTDDDKIRLQLYVDVSHFVKQLSFVELSQSTRSLEEVVTTAAESCLKVAEN